MADLAIPWRRSRGRVRESVLSWVADWGQERLGWLGGGLRRLDMAVISRGWQCMVVHDVQPMSERGEKP